ncbi:hypothetical protein NPIL_665751 [Nephila pilipes]|uniref:Uncharacterized protein n=1 Tax=Nephila pilipes TaxID=299642 RepID=A0A8X6PXV5_NEPPI|nr:hypothetical protein NPIL_665751 [Nephila pilipes]
MNPERSSFSSSSVPEKIVQRSPQPPPDELTRSRTSLSQFVSGSSKVSDNDSGNITSSSEVKASEFVSGLSKASDNDSGAISSSSEVFGSSLELDPKSMWNPFPLIRKRYLFKRLNFD